MMQTSNQPASVDTPSPSTSSQSSNQLLSNNRCLKCKLSQPTSPSPWISCASCSSPWHWSCVTINQLDPIDVIEKWFCGNCTRRDPSLVPIYKEAPRKSARVKPKKTSYSDSSIDPESNPDRFINLASGKKNVIDAFDVPTSGPHKPFRKMKASELNLQWLVQDEHAMTEPVVIDDQDGLNQMGMRMPPKDLSISKIAELVGTDTPVEVIDVASQAELSRWTLGQWAHYFEHPRRDRVRNVISLEVSETPLGPSIQLPRIVTDMDWVHTVWPSNLRVHGSGSYPKVQKYCLMSVARCWTDWHIDFAGSSVFYHILRGAKTFYFIRPTVANLAKYEKWSGSSKLQESTWLGDQVNVVYKVSLTAGQTMMIPTGWIHAVHTPTDSLVFGGNFLHSLNIPTQLRVHQIENSTKVPKKFRFPFFIHIVWFVLLSYYQKIEQADEQTRDTTDLNSSSNLDSFWPIPNRILTGLLALSEFLLTQTDLSDSHPALNSKDLSIYLESLLKTDQISNLRETVLKFQKLLNKFQTNRVSLEQSNIKPASREDLTQSVPAVKIAKGDDNQVGKPPETFKSPLHITIKRKISGVDHQTAGKTMTNGSSPENKSCNNKTSSKVTTVKAKDGNQNHKTQETKKRKSEEKVKVEETKGNRPKKNPTSESKSNTDAKKKLVSSSTSTSTTTPNKLIGGEILVMTNPTPTNEVGIQRRKRPKFKEERRSQEEGEEKEGGDMDESKPKNKSSSPSKSVKSEEVVGDDPGSSSKPKPIVDSQTQTDLLEEVEVRTTHALNSVVRKWIDPSRNKIVYETRTVKTTIEKVYFDP